MFGASIALNVNQFTDIEQGNGLRIAVGNDVSTGIGGTYAYRWWDGRGWIGQRFNYSGTPAAGSQFGWAVDISGTHFVGGAPAINMFFSARTTQAGSLVESTPFSSAGTKTLSADFSDSTAKSSSPVALSVDAPRRRERMIGANVCSAARVLSCPVAWWR